MSLRDIIGLGIGILSLHFARLKYFYLMVLAIVAFFVLFVWWILFRAPTAFPQSSVITIPPGQSVTAIAQELKEEHVIESVFLFKVIERLSFDTRGIQAGKYIFYKPAGVFTVVNRLTHGVSGIPTVKLTFPEGTTVRQMGDMLAAALPGFNGQAFDSLAIPHEGYLFPDTYFFLADTSPDDALASMRGNFAAHERDLSKKADEAGRTVSDVVVMASILEAEGKTLEDKRMIAGILWHRIALKMPLQVDAAFGYIYGRTGYTPTSADLSSNSAYNTYRYRGLPPTPINNPGEDSIDAALHPTNSAYLYYLTDKDGGMHYAKTFAEHVANKKKYLK